jgi:hypothetical protein
MCASIPIHQYAFVWNRSVLLERCRSNDGRRPINLQPNQIAAQYKGVSLLRPDEALLPGVFESEDPSEPRIGGSWWLRRSGSDWRIEAQSTLEAVFWPGCVIDDELWLNRTPNVVVGVRRDATTGIDSFREIEIPLRVMDFAEVVCLPEERLVVATEALSGSSMWAVSTESGAVRQLTHSVGGMGAMARRGRPGELIVANGRELLVFSMKSGEIIERTPASVQMFGGLDVCPADREAAVCDVTGRCRFFHPDEQGRYRFAWGLSVHAPRELVYSPDCNHIVIASWDDESVWLIDRATRSIAATYRVGPALRGITFLGPREFAVADACTMSDFVF